MKGKEDPDTVTWDDYCDFMALSDSWAGEIETQAAANLLDITIESWAGNLDPANAPHGRFRPGDRDGFEPVACKCSQQLGAGVFDEEEEEQERLRHEKRKTFVPIDVYGEPGQGPAFGPYPQDHNPPRSADDRPVIMIWRSSSHYWSIFDCDRDKILEECQSDHF